MLPLIFYVLLQLPTPNPLKQRLLQAQLRPATKCVYFDLATEDKIDVDGKEYIMPKKIIYIYNKQFEKKKELK